MTARERILAALVGLLAVMMIAYFVGTGYFDAVIRRTNRLQAVERELETQLRTIEIGTRAADEIVQLRQRSMPADREQAQALYLKWLLNLVNQVGMTDPSVRVGDRRLSSGHFDRSSYTVDGDATLEQIVQLLYRFYSSDDLHRIQSLALRPIPDTEGRRLDVSMTIETIILPDNDRKTVGDLVSSRLGETTEDSYQRIILDRNVFGPPNQAPVLDVVAEKGIHLGEELEMTIRARDPNKDDNLTFNLVGYIPEGAELDSESGRLRWQPEEKGEYEFSVQVADDGTPQLTDEMTFVVAVTDAPPKVADDDDVDEAEFTYLIGTISNEPHHEIWLHVRTTGRVLRLSVGDAVKVGTLSGVVQEISNKQVRIRTDAGELVVRVGQKLSEGRLDDEPLGRAAAK